MPLKTSSRIVKYVPATYPTERWRILKDATILRKLVVDGKGDSDDVFNANIIEKYEARPTTGAAEPLRNMSLMEFVSW